MTDIQKCKMCDGFGMVGNMLESETCPECNGDRYEGNAMKSTYEAGDYVVLVEVEEITIFVFEFYSEADPGRCYIGDEILNESIVVNVAEIRPATEQEIAEYEEKAND